MMKYVKSLVAILSLATLISTSAIAKNIEIDAQGTAFKPMVVFVEPGDTVTFANMTGHLSTTGFVKKDGSPIQYIPEGAKGWTSELGENFTTPPLTVEGVYFYKCTPHWGLGMGGSIVVGKPTNLEAIKATKPKGPLKRIYKKTVKEIEKRDAEAS